MKKWGQHFLASSRIAQSIVEAANLGPDDEVIEIGPGHGELTGHYIENVSRTILIEVDPSLAQKLSQRWGHLHGRLVVLTKDIREVDFQTLPLSRPPVVLGNLPYYVSKPVISKLLEWGGFDRAVVMLQKEVGTRLLAQPGDGEYSLSSVLFGLRASGKVLMDLGPEDFKPAPKVDSAVVFLRPRKNFSKDIEPLERLLRFAFTSRRQKLVNNLARGFPKIKKSELEKILSSLGINANARPQEVSAEGFLRLVQAFFREPSGGM